MRGLGKTFLFFIALFYISGCSQVSSEKSEKSPELKPLQKAPVYEHSRDFTKMHERLVDEALDAYNAENSKDFYKNFSAERLGLTDEVFKAIWINDYKARFGNLLSKKLLPDKCDLNAVSPLLVYRGKFEKNPDVIVKVTFIKDKDSNLYKLFYIRFDADLGW